LRKGVPLVGGEPVEPCSLAVVLWQTAAAVLIEECESGLAGEVPPVGGELVKPCGLAVVLWQAAKAELIKDPEMACAEALPRPAATL
jgi:hypothetical protein